MRNGKPHPMNPSDIDLSDLEFWNQPLDARDRAFDILRQLTPVSWQAPPLAFAPEGSRPPRGYWAVTRHADIRRVHRDSKTFSAATGTFLFDNMSQEDEYAAAGMMGTDRRVIASYEPWSRAPSRRVRWHGYAHRPRCERISSSRRSPPWGAATSSKS
jgi:cytochrome P450